VQRRTVQRWTVQWMTVQGAGAAAEAAGAAGHEEGARVLPALGGAAGPLALATRPPPDAPAFDAVAYGVAPPQVSMGKMYSRR
jgi:hypothetical protein